MSIRRRARGINLARRESTICLAALPALISPLKLYFLTVICAREGLEEERGMGGGKGREVKGRELEGSSSWDGAEASLLYSVSGSGETETATATGNGVLTSFNHFSELESPF